MPWTAEDIPRLEGRTIVVTGATSGLGEATTVALATRGAHVVLAARSVERAGATMANILDRVPSASVEHLPLDLSDLASVRSAAAVLAERHDRVDAVVANAGIMAPPLQRTVDGFELQFGVNHLGHFALVGLTLPLVLAAPAGRVVVVSSGAHRVGSIDLDDLNWERTRYQRWPAYGRSKLANLLHVLELQRRLESAGAAAIAVGAHPGYTSTALQTTGPTMQGGLSGRVTGLLSSVGNAVLGQPVAKGVLPQLYATVAPGVDGGSYWGPDGPGEMRGYPAPADRTRAALDAEVAHQLWERSEELTGVTVALDGAAA
jgi:NAD(P)-dependent dehydrogenase (short-subunit alcohol dehydrogenase family)